MSMVRNVCVHKDRVWDRWRLWTPGWSTEVLVLWGISHSICTDCFLSLFLCSSRLCAVLPPLIFCHCPGQLSFTIRLHCLTHIILVWLVHMITSKPVLKWTNLKKNRSRVACHVNVDVLKVPLKRITEPGSTEHNAKLPERQRRGILSNKSSGISATLRLQSVTPWWGDNGVSCSLTERESR